MKTFYHVKQLEVDLSICEEIIPSVTMDSILDMNELILQNKEKAVRYLLQARKERQLRKEELNISIENIKQQAYIELENSLHDLRADAINQAVVKLQEDSDYERQLFSTVIIRASDELKKALNSLIPEVNWSELLGAKVSKIIKNFEPGSSFIVKIGGSNYSHLKNVLNSSDVIIQEATDLTDGMAVIETPHMRLNIDYDSQITQLVDYLNGLHKGFL
ncbi:hypothetical protein D5952_14110 [Salmonella enterica subsp. enterica]|nr:hypothetical protein [Salmonella enterica subsp. enterica serovar Bonn]EBZ5939315.1 hypothetical protein [Salmonella enterica subsp. enterica serovar Muenchen]MLZ41058.1 hypothetical protein [Salmonella enterica subsp. enterica serovar Bonn]